MPTDIGSTTQRTAAAQTAASAALPPACRQRRAESTASGWLVAAIPEREIVSVEGTRPGYGIGDAY